MNLKNRTGINIGRINYINVDPIYFGLENNKIDNDYNIIPAHPSLLNKMLAEKKLDISAVSSAAYAQNQDKWLILPDLSVSCFGNVLSVLFVSRVSAKKLDGKKVIISDESKTASDLVKTFFYSQNINPVFVRKKIFSHENVTENAALIIGDAALRFEWGKHFEYIWDLGDLWENATGFPFVFALWAIDKEFAESNRKKAISVLKDLHTSREIGLKNMDKIVKSGANKLEIEESLCRAYFSKLDFGLDEKQISGLRLFFDRLYNYNIVNKKIELSFFE